MALSFVRITEFTVSSMSALFNDDLDTDIGVNNITITPTVYSVPTPEVKSVSVDNELLTFTFSPLFPNVQYKFAFVSTSSQSFQTDSGEAILEDGTRNAFFEISPGDDVSEVRDSILDNITPVVYETGERNLLRDVVSTEAYGIQKAKDALATVKAGNYLSVLVEDELKTRGSGPTDKLDNGGAFEILRVGSTPTGQSTATTLEFSSTRSASFSVRSGMNINSVIATFPSDPVSLQSVDVINEKVTDDTQLANHFDGMTIKVSKSPVIQVISVSLLRDSTYTEYNVESFGYTLKSNRYDTDSASINVNFADNEIELSSSSITGTSGGFLLPRAGDEIYISYVYKRLGRDVDSPVVSRIRTSTRETTDPIATKFTLDNAPIVTSADVIPTTGGVSFLNTQASGSSAPFESTHPAFTSELPYDTSRFPAKPGEYTVNYNTGDVVVFGEDLNNEGTGNNAPVATYNYRQLYVQDLDFTFNSDRDEIAASSTRSLAGVASKISFNKDDVFDSGTDYRSLSHVEVLNERINNNIDGAFTITPANMPITDVFRILNETTGELYTVSRFSDTHITFVGRDAPRQKDVTREKASFTRVPQETLLVSDELTNSSSLKVFKIALANSGITGSRGRFIGANFNTSVLFSDTDIFIREFYYEDRLFTSVTTNINRLTVVGDYSIDYNNGIVYVAVSSTQSTDLGDISYECNKIETKNKHILDVNNIYRSQNAAQAHISTYTTGTVTDTTVVATGLEQTGERFINDSSARVLIVGSYQSGEDGVTSGDRFVSNSAIFTSDDVGRTINVGSSADTPVESVEIITRVSNNEVVVYPSFASVTARRVWNVVDLTADSDKTITLNHDIVAINAIYTTTDLGTYHAAGLTNYYNSTTDTFSGNVITLDDDSALDIGDAVIVDYDCGNVFIDYRYLQDEIVVSYEYGNNSIDWSISDELETGEEYYVTYKYGALRDSLLLNFGALTQVPELTTFSPTLDREVYRSVVGGALQSFIKGPTVPSIETLVEAFTDVTPDISETIFDNWILGRDKLHPRKPVYSSNQVFDLGKFNNGALLDANYNIKVPAISNLRLDEGTMEAWVRPQWKGLANDATLTFDMLIDGYLETTDVFIGSGGNNPSSTSFTLTSTSTSPSVSGQPTNIDDDTGYFIWYDDSAEIWNVRWRGNSANSTNFTGTITTSGEFYNVVKPVDSDGYEINEVSDLITSTKTSVEFSAYIDGYDDSTDAYGVTTTQYAMDGVSFISGDIHYLFDMAYGPSSNRMSVFKDGAGYLNFQVYDNKSDSGLDAGFYNLSYNVSGWSQNELHHIATSWEMNSPDEKDELHMFVDGAEVPNLFKYGGNPTVSSLYDFGDVAEETIITDSPSPILGGFDGSTESGSKLFQSASANFIDNGVQVGSSFYLLDATADGTGSPNLGTPYTVMGVGSTSLALDRAPTGTLGSLQYSVNQVTSTVTTPINIQDIAVFAVDAYGTETELEGVDAEEPDYAVSRGSDDSHTIKINNGVSAGDDVVIKQLGLILQQCKEKIYVYGDNSDEIRANTAAPATLGDVDITATILDKKLIEADGYDFEYANVIEDGFLITIIRSTLESADFFQPTNDVRGKKLKITMSGDRFDFTINRNNVVITGETYSGATTETVSFTESGSKVTSEYWTLIDSIVISAAPVDLTLSAGMVEIVENTPITSPENNGDYAEVIQYANGIFKLQIYGAGGAEFNIREGFYTLEYPSYTRIRVDKMPDTFFIGSDYLGNNRFDGVVDEFRILDIASQDTRTGEELVGTRSITTDYNQTEEFDNTTDTLCLLHFNDTVENDAKYRDRYDRGIETAPSLNDDFGTALKIRENRPYLISNAGTIFNNDEGSIEFWVNPLDDSRGDPNFHYYIDMSSFVEEETTSTSAVVVKTNQRAREIDSVRLLSDTQNSGIDYFAGGSISNVDSKTLTLGTPLPLQNTPVKIIYAPLSTNGDRVSIYRDPEGRINFFMRASEVEHLITVPMSWNRHTWHRIMVMWKTNSVTNQDRLRLFVDGSERGTIKYGTGLIYGTGIIYGQAEVRPGTNRFLVSNIDLLDTFSRLYIGTDINRLNGARALLDNIRFSSIQRLQTIRTTSNDIVDTNYNSNSSVAIPVISDLYTTAIYNFDTTEEDIEFLATIVNAERGIFKFKVDVIDSFDKVIGDTFLEGLLVDLINQLKPSHTESTVIFTE